MELTVRQILGATGGELVQGGPDGAVTDVTIDSRAARPGSLFVPLPGSRADGHDFIAAARASGAAALVRQGHGVLTQLPAAGTALIAVADPLRALGDIAAHWRRRFDLKVVAITGSNGKTSTKEMAAGIAARRFRIIKNPGNFNNLIGLPLSLFALEQRHEVAILELGMSEPGEIDRLAEICDPDVGIITNVGPSHLEQLKTLERIAAAKGELFGRLGPQDTAIVNTGDGRVARLAQGAVARRITYALAGGDVHASAVAPRPDAPGMQFDLHVMGAAAPVRLGVPGEQFVINALAAAAIAASLGMGIADIAAGLEAFAGVPGRMETFERGGRTFINDAYNANPVSTRAALAGLRSLAGRRRAIAVLGDMLELGDDTPAFHEEIGRAAAQAQLEYLFIAGDHAAHTRAGALQAGMAPERLFTGDLDAIAARLGEIGRPGDVVLLKGSRRMKMETILHLLGLEGPGAGQH